MNQVARQVVHLQEKDVASITLPGRIARPFVGRDKGAQLLSTGTVTFPSHSVSAPHAHSTEEEALYVLEGEGEIVCGDQALALQPGSFVFIPPGVRHSVHNTGDRSIKFFYAFSPPVVIGSW